MADKNWGWFGNRSSGEGIEFETPASSKNWGWFGNRSSGEGIEFEVAATAWSEHAWLRGGQYIMAAQAGVPNVNGSADAHVGVAGSSIGVRAALGSAAGRVGTAGAEAARKGAYSTAVAALGITSTDTARKGAIAITTATLGAGGAAATYKTGLAVIAAMLGTTSTSSGTQQGGAPALSGGAAGTIGFACDASGVQDVLYPPVVPGIGGPAGGYIPKREAPLPKRAHVGFAEGALGVVGMTQGTAALTHRPVARRRREELFLIAA